MTECRRVTWKYSIAGMRIGVHAGPFCGCVASPAVPRAWSHKAAGTRVVPAIVQSPGGRRRDSAHAQGPGVTPRHVAASYPGQGAGEAGEGTHRLMRSNQWHGKPARSELWEYRAGSFCMARSCPFILQAEAMRLHQWSPGRHARWRVRSAVTPPPAR